MKISADTFFRTEHRPRRRPARPVNFPVAACTFLATALLISGCGKIGDPLPPIPRAPLIVDELSVAQQGTQLVLSFPLVRTARSQRLQRIDVYRLIEPAGDPLGLPEETFSSRATVIYSVPPEQIPAQSSSIVYRDPLDLKSGVRNTRYRYAVRLVNSAGQAADLSNYATITPLFDLALPPVGLKAVQRETEIELNWSAPAANESGTSPSTAAGYQLYRRDGETDAPLVRLNAAPLTEPRFIDRNFQFGAKYQYLARSLSTLPGSADLSRAIESNDSEALAYTPKDTFPPSEPVSITIASINGLVSLFWPLNPEADVAGYNIYRSEDDQTPPDRWIKLNQQLHKTASFRDDRVQVGKQYFYQITAVDIYGNQSRRSATVSETVAP